MRVFVHSITRTTSLKHHIWLTSYRVVKHELKSIILKTPISINYNGTVLC